MPKTTVRHFFARKISTAQYETLDVQSGFEEEVEYKDTADLEAKSSVIRERAITALGADLNAACEALGVSEKRAFLKSPNVAARKGTLGEL